MHQRDGSTEVWLGKLVNLLGLLQEHGQLKAATFPESQHRQPLTKAAFLASSSVCRQLTAGLFPSDRHSLYYCWEGPSESCNYFKAHKLC